MSRDDANYSGKGGKDIWKYTSPVGSFSPNGYGLYDMAGNVWEWSADWYDDKYYANSPKKNPKGPSLGFIRVVRGGSWGNSYDNLRVDDNDNLRVACRYSYGIDPTYGDYYIGFRCVR